MIRSKKGGSFLVPRYNYVYEKAAEFLEDLQENLIYPLDFEKIISSKGWNLFKYSDLDKLHYSISPDGYSLYASNNFNIFINMFQPSSRRQFTYGHEIGHITLNHHLEFKKDLLSHNSDVKDALEREANCFARLIIAPAEIIRFLRPRTPYLIHKIFNVSQQVVEIRLTWVNKDFERSKFNNQLTIFKVFQDINAKMEKIIDNME